MNNEQWTAADLQTVREAMKALATGKRITRASFSGSNGIKQCNEYACASLTELLALSAHIESALQKDGTTQVQADE